MIRRPPRATRADTLFPYTTLFRSLVAAGSVDAAFHLVPAAPASGARIFARLHHAGARRAADRQISLGLQRMARQIMFGEIGVQPGLVQVGKGLDLQPPVLDLEAGRSEAHTSELQSLMRIQVA